MSARARLLVVDDDAAFRRILAAELERLGFAVAMAGSGEEALRKLEETEPEVALVDLRLPGISGLEVLEHVRINHPAVEVIVLTGHGSIDTAIESIRRGAFDYITKPCPMDEMQVRIERAMERRELRRRTSLLERGLLPPDLRNSIVGDSKPFRRMLQMIERVAPADATVLITGETGAGKDRAAKLLHALSSRNGRPFVVVECAALQESLLQSELFGHEKGAFTGADRAKAGLFEVAHGGTIFLDEIGEITPATQVKLLRVLDTSTFRRVGGTSEIHVDVRMIAATNRDLPAMVRQGLFREDLYFRLSTITLEVPPLREREDDVALLARHMVRQFSERYGTERQISPEAMERLRRHSWPGNVRELLHAVESAMIVCDGPQIRPEHLPRTVTAPRGEEKAPCNGTVPLLSLEEMERRHIRAALESAEGHRGNAAKILGISERNLYRKLREYKLLN